MVKKVKIYFAAPLFSEADRMFNLFVYNKMNEALSAKGIKDKVETYIPQLNEAINDKNSYASAEDIVMADGKELESSDIFIALLDNEDSGVALEAGMAFATQKPMIGLWTDSRQLGGDNEKKLSAVKEIGQNQFAYINLMLSGLFLLSKGLYNDVDEFVSEIVEEVECQLNHVENGENA